jgi:glycosyltransferase involved in cell wall biosynthesis
MTEAVITISLCMIVKNEEKVLGRCLSSVQKAVDEIIIVDTGSTDKTKEIASKFTDKVYDFEWIDDFSAARNKAFSYATMDYQMWLDADDVVTEENLEKLLKLKETLDPNVDIVTMKYYTHFNENGDPILTSTRERLMKREKNYKWHDPIHEYIQLTGNVLNSDITIYHYKNHHKNDSMRNIKIYNALEEKGVELSPRQLYYYARELKDHAQYEKAIYYFEKFLDSKRGWYEDNIGACYSLSICYKATNSYDKILPILLKSFEYDSPRAEICSEIGYYYKLIGNYKVALNWFDLAANLKKPDSIGFILTDYWGYIPNLEACVCSYILGDLKKSEEYNEKAALYRPYSEAVATNRKLFEQLKKQNKLS